MTFICVDIEAIEVAPNPVSEIGIAVLNSERLKGIAAGPSGANWWDFIEAHHVRVKEYAGLVNYRFVQGCPNNFDFGFVPNISFTIRYGNVDTDKQQNKRFPSLRRTRRYIKHYVCQIREWHP